MPKHAERSGSALSPLLLGPPGTAGAVGCCLQVPVLQGTDCSLRWQEGTGGLSTPGPAVPCGGALRSARTLERLRSL